MPQYRTDNIGNMRKRFLQLHPVNAASGGQFSFKNGLPLIKFDISSATNTTMLDGAEVRLSGRFTARSGADASTDLNPQHMNFLDGYTGINQCIETCTIASKRLNSVLERVTNYNRLIPSIISGTHDSKEIETIYSHMANQHQTPALTRAALNSYNQYNTAGEVAVASRKGQSFSTPLYAGMLHSENDIDISVNGTGGLTIEILLRSDVGVVFGANASALNTSYTLSDLVLTCPVYELQGQGNGEVSNYEFNSWSSMFQTINTSASVIAMTPGLAQVSSAICNFVTANDLGNQNFNSSRLGTIGEVQQLRWTKNGALYPKQFRSETINQQNNDVAKTAAGNAQSNHVYNVSAEIVRDGLEALKVDRYNKVHNCSQAYNSWQGGAVDKHQNCGRDGVTPGSSYQWGILMDAYGAGTNFSQTIFGVEVQASGTSTLDVGGVLLANSLTGASATAQACVLYFLNKNTLMMSPQGIQVVR